MRSIIETYKRLTNRITANEIAMSELKQATLDKLAAETASEYYEAMVMYHTQRIDRLSKFLMEEPVV